MISCLLRIALCAVLLGAASARAAITFVRPTVSTTVPMPGFMTVADFNRDGRADLAISSPQSSEVAVLLGTAAGALTGSTTYEVGKQLSDIAAGDIDGDGIPDIAVADQRGSGIHVLIGAGDGTFAQPIFVSAGRTAAAVIIADLDGVNHADLVVADKGDNRVLVLLNSGRAPLTFSAGGQYDVGQGPERVLLGDFNGDAHPDIVTLNTGGLRVKDISVLLFDRVAGGLPIYHLLASFGASEAPSRLTSGDFNGDSKLDLAMLNLPGGRNNGSIDFLLGVGNGFLIGGPSLALPCPVFTNDLVCRGRAFAVSDFDADGTLDLAVTQIDPRAATEEDWLAIYSGDDDGMFLPGPILGTDPVPSLVSVGDVTGDGAPDIIVGSDRTHTVEVFVNTSAGAAGDRLPGQACDNDPQCTTGLCRDTVCCRTDCAHGERCNLPNRLGTCTPEDQQRPRGERCENGNQCESTFCVDQVCCVAGACPTGARCDIPSAAGVCSSPADIGAACERGEQCRSEFCVDQFCCSEACPEGRCDAPGREGTCSGSLVDGQACSANAQCISGVCDTAAHICCAQRCAQNQQCAADGATCELMSAPTPTVSGTPAPTPTATQGAFCAGDCDGSQAVAVSELVTGVNIALGRGSLETCHALDTNGDERVSVNELVAAVGTALRGCGVPLLAKEGGRGGYTSAETSTSPYPSPW